MGDFDDTETPPAVPVTRADPILASLEAMRAEVKEHARRITEVERSVADLRDMTKILEEAIRWPVHAFKKALFYATAWVREMETRDKSK